MDADLIKVILPVIATTLAPVIIFFVTQRVNRASNQMAALNSRADFLKKLIDLQESQQDLQESNVKKILLAELDSFFGVIEPILLERNAEMASETSAKAAFKKISIARRLLLMYRPLSFIGYFIALLYYFTAFFCIVTAFGAEISFEVGERVNMYTILMIIFLYYVIFLIVMTILNISARVSWERSYAKSIA
jgi:hypothetical protein